MQKTRAIRSKSQQLDERKYLTPTELVSWMGAIQAQDYPMAKWAIGIRMGNTTNKLIEQAFDKGEILRTHVMRPTWHFVANEDIRWMLQLSKDRILSMFKAANQYLELDDKIYNKCNDLLVKSLEGNNHLTREEVGQVFVDAGIAINTSRMIHIMMQAELEGIICSGAMRGKKQTYALLHERVTSTNSLTKEESIYKLALRYFRSHSPASIQDFVWWSGLTVKDARQAIAMLGTELVEDKFATDTMYVHQSYIGDTKIDDKLHLLPSYDEYIISYKDRKAVLSPDHQHMAHNKSGIFYPIVAYKGEIVGSWRKNIKKNTIDFDITFFDNVKQIPEVLLEKAKKEYRDFMEI